MIFPVVFTTISTNPIILPKQVLLGGSIIILLILQAIKMLVQRSVKLKRTYLDIPILLFMLFAFLSAIFAVNKADALTAFISFFFAILGFFLIVNTAKDKNSILFLTFSFIMGSILLSLLSILSFFKIYILPSVSTHTQIFTPLGSLLDQDIYLIIAFAISCYYLLKPIKLRRGKEEKNAISYLEESGSKDSLSLVTKTVFFATAFFVILTGIIVTTYGLFKLDKPLVLPIEAGFQTAFKEISLDSGRIAQGFLFGSGFGTYSADFSRWKEPSFNQNQDLWNLTFIRSSNFVLELLATTGVLGLGAFLFLLIRVLKEMRATLLQNAGFLSLLLMFMISFLLPLNFVTQTLFFIVLGIFAANQGLISKTRNRFFDIELQIVAFKKGFIAMELPHVKNERSLILPSIIAVIISLLAGIIGYFSIIYVISDMVFQKGLVAASQNNATLTYQNQAKAIEISKKSPFVQKDGFYRVFSQTNLALANALAAQQPKDSPPNQDIQQQITLLIQQAIDTARAASTIAPQTTLNWQNLSSIYRSLIGFGQNAETFAIATAQQAISLDPANPQQYITLGGIYYQLGQWENAEREFRNAVSLKPDYPNAYYNLGHALEEKGDFQNALVQYQVVRTLLSNDKTSLEQIDREIAALQGKAEAKKESATNNNQALNVNKPEAQLPSRNPPVKIPAPNVATESSR